VRRAGAGLILVAGLAMAGAGAARAEVLVVDLSQHRIAITSGFTGADVLLFGARDGEGDVVVVLRGPERPVYVRRKARIAGMWLNRDEVEFADAPGFYAVAASQPLKKLVPPDVLAENQIGVGNLTLSTSYTGSHTDLDSFRTALFRNMQRRGLYLDEEGDLRFVGNQLFRTQFPLPANVPTGLYHADVYLIGGGVVISKRTTALEISKTGFEAAMFDMSRRRPLLYGLVAVAIALVAGWLAGLVFRKR